MAKPAKGRKQQQLEKKQAFAKPGNDCDSSASDLAKSKQRRLLADHPGRRAADTHAASPANTTPKPRKKASRSPAARRKAETLERKRAALEAEAVNYCDSPVEFNGTAIVPPKESSLGQIAATDTAVELTDAVLDESVPSQESIQRYFSSEQAQLQAGDPPLLSRKQKQARKGLPARENLAKLARVWLETTAECWPELVESGVVLRADEHAVANLVEQFEFRFIEAKVIEFKSRVQGKCPYEALAAGYLRYSDDNSNPRSLDDQLALQVRRSKRDKRFLSWEYIFCDASVTGRTHLRRGYVLAKQTMIDLENTALDTFYFDDFGRATRGAIESFRLAKLMEQLRKRLIGVSDGFDLSGQNSKIVVMATAMYNEMFIDQLREKVMRGMRGAAERGTVLGKLRFGYRSVPKLDKLGQPMFHNKDKSIRIAEISPKDMKHVIEAAELFTASTSYGRLAKMFNAQKVGGRTGWGASTIRDLLACPLFIGVAIFNRTRTEFDVETGEFVVKQNDRKHWIRKVIPKLAAWTLDLWRRVRRRAWAVRTAAPQTGKPNARNQAYPSTIFSGTLWCKHCKAEIQLIRSSKKSKQLACMNGTFHKHNCPLHSSKSTRIVEDCLLDWVKQHILNAHRIRQLVGAANLYLVELAKKPRQDTRPLEQKIRRLEKEEAALVDFVVAHRAKHDMSAYLEKSDKLAKELSQLRKRRRDLNAANAPPPAPLVLSDVLSHIEDFRGLLNTSIVEAAESLRPLFGRIHIHQECESAGRGRGRGAVWIAEFGANVVRFLAFASCNGSYPDAASWEFLSFRNWIPPEPIRLEIRETTKWEPLVPKVREFLARRPQPSILAIAAELKADRALVSMAKRWIETGVRPKWPDKEPGRNRRRARTATGLPPLRKSTKGSQLVTPDLIALVGERRGMLEHSFRRISRDTGLSLATIEKAYDAGHPEKLRDALLNGGRAMRGPYSYDGPTKQSQIDRHLAEGKSYHCIAKLVGCGVATVRRAATKTLSEAGGFQ